MCEARGPGYCSHPIILNTSSEKCRDRRQGSSNDQLEDPQRLEVLLLADNIPMS